MSIIVLGKENSYTDLAAQTFIKKFGLKDKISYYHHIDACFKSFAHDDYLILPIENSIDGFLQHHMDLLYASGASIIGETYQSISFDFVSYQKASEIRHVVGHETALHQCTQFLKDFSHVSFHHASHNIESLEMLNTYKLESWAAIIPSHLTKDIYVTHKKHIHDIKDNHTRFFLLSKNKTNTLSSKTAKCYLVIEPNKDYAGLLQEILNDFKAASINLTSIISRPLKTKMGHYRFFIECDLSDTAFNDFINILSLDKSYKINLLGLYKKEDI